MAGNFSNIEILQIADSVSREKSIDPSIVLGAMEESIAVAASKKYGYDRNIKVFIDKKTGEVQVFREIRIVEDDYELEEKENENNILRISDAGRKKSDAVVGDVIQEPLPPIDFGRVAAQTAKQVIVQRVREAEREKQYNDFLPRVGEIIIGSVKRVEFGNVIVEFGAAEAIITRSNLINGEEFKINDRVSAYIKNVSRESRGCQIFLSRTDNGFLAKLFEQEVPEVYDNIIEIKGISREPGVRAKIAVTSNDSNIDPIGSCVGMRGMRVKAVTGELQGERIDIIHWSPDTAKYLVNALAPAEVQKIIIDEDNNRIEAVVSEDQFKLAVGRAGQNVRLASQLTGWDINILTEDNDSRRQTEEFNRLSALFIESLNIEDMMAHVLVTEGFTNIKEIANADIKELSSIEGFDDNVAEALKERAAESLEEEKKNLEIKIKELGIEQSLIDLEGMDNDLLISLEKVNIKSLDAFADLSRDDFLDLIPDTGLTFEQIDSLIMLAREHWFLDKDSLDKV